MFTYYVYYMYILVKVFPLDDDHLQSQNTPSSPKNDKKWVMIQHAIMIMMLMTIMKMI